MDYYSSISKGYNKFHKEEQLKKVKIILRYIKKTDKVLDVGCGTAFYRKYIKNYTGIDNSPGMLPKDCILADAEKLPFKDKSFDIVISITALHNVKNPEKAIKEIKRVTKGKIAISILKRSKKFKKIKTILNKYFKNLKEIEEEKDIIFIN